MWKLRHKLCNVKNGVGQTFTLSNEALFNESKTKFYSHSPLSNDLIQRIHFFSFPFLRNHHVKSPWTSVYI